MTTSKYDLEVVAVKLRLQGVLILHDINFKLLPGETLFVTGDSGAGKTSLLKLITKDLSTTSGRVVWRKKDLRIGVVHQNIHLLKKSSLIENLWIAYQPGVHESYMAFESQVLELSKYFHLFDKLDKKISILNGGSLQLVSIMRALLSKPDILVLDEPTKALDERASLKVFEALNFYSSKKGISLIWASHNRALVKQFSGKMIHLEQGRIVYTGQACFI